MSNPYESFRLVTIDKVKKVQIDITLEDQNKEEVPLSDICTEMKDLLLEAAKAGENQQDNPIRDKLMPLMASIIGQLLPELAGRTGIALLGTPESRALISLATTAGFLLLKRIQKSNLKIIATEESLTDDEIEAFLRESCAFDAALYSSLLGKNDLEDEEDGEEQDTD